MAVDDPEEVMRRAGDLFVARSVAAQGRLQPSHRRAHDLFVARSIAAEPRDKAPNLSSRDLLAFLTDPAFSLAPEQTALLFATERLLTDYRLLKQQLLVADIPPLAASNDNLARDFSCPERVFAGGQIEIKRSSALSEFVLTLQARHESPGMLLMESRAEELVKVPLPLPDNAGRVHFSMAPDKGGATLARLLQDPTATGALLARLPPSPKHAEPLSKPRFWRGAIDDQSRWTGRRRGIALVAASAALLILVPAVAWLSGGVDRIQNYARIPKSPTTQYAAAPNNPTPGAQPPKQNVAEGHEPLAKSAKQESPAPVVASPASTPGVDSGNPLPAKTPEQSQPAAVIAPAPMPSRVATAATSRGEGVQYASAQAAFEQGLGAYKSGYYQIAIPALEEAARSGPELSRFFAEFYLARIYSDNSSALTNHAKAYELFQKLAIENADADPEDGRRAPFVAKALTALAGYLKRGITEIGVRPDPERAFALLQHAATIFGDQDAQFELAKGYLSGRSGEDVKRGMQYLSVLTEKGYPSAQAFLAELYWRGRHVKKDEMRALALITVAVENAPENERIWIEDIYQNIFCGTSQGTRKQADGIVATWKKIFTRPDAPSDRMGLGALEPQRKCGTGEVIDVRRGGARPPKEPPPGVAATPPAARSEPMHGANSHFGPRDAGTLEKNR